MGKIACFPGIYPALYLCCSFALGEFADTLPSLTLLPASSCGPNLSTQTLSLLRGVGVPLPHVGNDVETAIVLCPKNGYLGAFSPSLWAPASLSKSLSTSPRALLPASPQLIHPRNPKDVSPALVYWDPVLFAFLMFLC